VVLNVYNHVRCYDFRETISCLTLPYLLIVAVQLAERELLPTY
jgi:hypothetical protein